jgi:GMP reductase
MNTITKEYSYDQIHLIPRKCIVNSRGSECHIRLKFGPCVFNHPAIAANMKSVVNEDTCIFLAKHHWFYIMHRFKIDNVKFIKKMKKLNLFTSISVGVNRDSYIELQKLKALKLYPDFCTIDIAHGWAPKAEKMIKYIKDNFPKTFVIAGNVCTQDAVTELDHWGADSIKVGIAGGKVCITKNKTGFHRPMASTVMDCVQGTNKPIIADGGVSEHGDIAKAIACGAWMVMCGSLFAGYDQSAGEVIDINDKLFKEYYGSASAKNKGARVHVEGKKILIDYKGDMELLLTELEEDLKSSVSYAGGKSINALHDVKIVSC